MYSNAGSPDTMLSRSLPYDSGVYHSNMLIPEGATSIFTPGTFVDVCPGDPDTHPNGLPGTYLLVREYVIQPWPTVGRKLMSGRGIPWLVLTLMTVSRVPYLVEV